MVGHHRVTRNAVTLPRCVGIVSSTPQDTQGLCAVLDVSVECSAVGGRGGEGRDVHYVRDEGSAQREMWSALYCL